MSAYLMHKHLHNFLFVRYVKFCMHLSCLWIFHRNAVIMNFYKDCWCIIYFYNNIFRFNEIWCYYKPNHLLIFKIILNMVLVNLDVILVWESGKRFGLSNYSLYICNKLLQWRFFSVISRMIKRNQELIGHISNYKGEMYVKS